MCSEPSYILYLIEIKPGTKLNIKVEPEDGLCAFHQTKPIPDSILRGKFWPEWKKIIEEVTK